MPTTQDGSISTLAAVANQLGADPYLVLHGGGNASVKAHVSTLASGDIPALFMKTSGTDMSVATAKDYVPLDLSVLRGLLPHAQAGTEDFLTTMQRARLDLSTAAPSVEALVHAALPHTYVLHSHADAIVSLTNTANGRNLVSQVLGEGFLVCDYAMPGPQLGHAINALWRAEGSAELHGIVVLNHGLFTFSATADEALSSHRAAVAAANAYIASETGHELKKARLEAFLPDTEQAVALATLRASLSERAGQPILLSSFGTDASALGILDKGPITPDHVNYTGHSAYDLTAHESDRVSKREAYLSSAPVEAEISALSQIERVMYSTSYIAFAGRSRAESLRARDITEHQIGSGLASMGLGGYVPADPDHVRDLEFWAPQQAKLKKADGAKPLAGRVALVTGAASGIGKACAQELLDNGATVVGWDISETVTTTFDTPEWIGQRVDVTDAHAQQAAIRSIIGQCGGLDIVVVAAGVFPTAQHLTELDPEMWARTISINVSSVATLFGLIQPFLALSPSLGRVCVVASKNFAAPGPGAAAYSSSKAALTQLSRVAALEWAKDGIRVNIVHPDAVFDTALWTEELLAKRAEHYGTSVEEYKRRNLLRTEVRSADVGRLVRAMADDTFIATTGAQVPIDGGNERVI